MYCSHPVIMDHTFYEPPVICSVCWHFDNSPAWPFQLESECNILLLCQLITTSPYTSTSWQCTWACIHKPNNGKHLKLGPLLQRSRHVHLTSIASVW